MLRCSRRLRRCRSPLAQVLELEARLLEQFELPPERKIRQLSKGMRTKLALLLGFARGCELLILDEPTEGIQPNIVHEIGDIVLRLNQEEGLTVLLVEQKLPFARRVASEFCILDKGRRVAAGPIGDLTDQVVRAHLSV